MLQKSPNEAVEKKPEITARFEDTFFKEDFDDVEPDAKRIKMNDDYWKEVLQSFLTILMYICSANSCRLSRKKLDWAM